MSKVPRNYRKADIRQVIMLFPDQKIQLYIGIEHTWEGRGEYIPYKYVEGDYQVDSCIVSGNEIVIRAEEVDYSLQEKPTY